MKNKEIFKKIIVEVVTNPQITNKELSTLVGVSQPTVARYRKRLEDDTILRYFTYVNNMPGGTNAFSARKLYLVYFREGITRKQVADFAFSEPHKKYFYNKHLFSAHVGDSEGRVVLVFMLESRVRGDFVDILNGEIVPSLTGKFGHQCIHQVTGVDIEETLRLFHNYEGKNMLPVDKSQIYVSDKL